MSLKLHITFSHKPNWFLQLIFFSYKKCPKLRPIWDNLGRPLGFPEIIFCAQAHSQMGIVIFPKKHYTSRWGKTVWWWGRTSWRPINNILHFSPNFSKNAVCYLLAVGSSLTHQYCPPPPSDVIFNQKLLLACLSQMSEAINVVHNFFKE